MISMPFVRKRRDSRNVIAMILYACMVMGCAPFSKTGLRDFKLYSFLPSMARDESDAPRSKPLSICEQRKLCISTAEQLAKSQHWSESIKLYEKAESYERFLPVLGESASHHNIGVILLDTGQEDMARIAFENATKCPDASAESKQFFAALQSNDVRITQR